MSARVRFLSDGIGILVKAEVLSALGLIPAGGIACPSKSASVAPILALAADGYRLWETKALEEGSEVGGVGCGVRIVDDDVVNVGGDAFQVFDDLGNHLDEPAGGGAAALRHDEPLQPPIGHAESV